jgi:hypothetical protein
MDDEVNVMTDNLDPKTEAQLSAEWKSACMQMCRVERDRLIAETDFIHMPDVTLDTDYKASLVTYRQELRDFPAAFGEVFDAMSEDARDGVTTQSMSWPTKP